MSKYIYKDEEKTRHVSIERGDGDKPKIIIRWGECSRLGNFVKIAEIYPIDTMGIQTSYYGPDNKQASEQIKYGRLSPSGSERYNQMFAVIAQADFANGRNGELTAQTAEALCNMVRDAEKFCHTVKDTAISR